MPPQTMPRITAAVLARDNQNDIGPCLESVAWADERLVILDDRSADRTEEIARTMGARVVHHPFRNFAEQRDVGLRHAGGDWLFYIDTDERATPALGEEIRRVVADDAYAGWWVPRRNWIWGHEIRHGGWFPDHQLRLLRVGCARYDPARPVHEVVLLDGAAAFLAQPLLHENYRTLGQYIAKQRHYTDLDAALLRDRGVRPKPWTYLAQPLREFWRRYVALRGYRDGLPGLALCLWTAYYYGLVTTVKLGRLWRER
jgi:glycosyltransferase involved in cell wall biosynthesis